MDTIYLILVSFIGIQKLEGFDELSRGKTATQSRIYPCYRVTCGPDKAVDGDRKTCMRSDYIGPLFPDKTTWWTVDLGGNHSIYSISIDFKDYKDYEVRQRGRFAGFSLFISNTPYKEDGHLCYKNTLPLPPLEFNTTCIGYGRYVIYYNERLDGVTYPKDYQSLVFTELCEVKIEGCSKSGVYGRNCSLSCPINCQEQRCNIVNGTCLGCVPGYIGQMCETECPFGWYGDLCKRQCTGHCNGNISCNHVTGYCDGGCAAGLMGKQCDQQCNMGTYGSGCLQNCTGHCLNNISCNRETGMCNSGCDEGYTGNFCEKECPPGRFGQDCLQECSGKCWNNSGCNHVDGECKEGCAAGYEGKLCNDEDEYLRIYR
ncbi:multiple epidermal growth factor-like domains protein 6 [Saccostrea cucullata]|uniref:multiple epidermal growth factor-like domains protein 6 n=1 Tax=Saccostrea cuccullata TaxID=36930 RepID=UPI002ED1BFA1